MIKGSPRALRCPSLKKTAVKGEILNWIKSHVDSGAVVVVVSHTIEPFIDLTSRAITIKDGSAILYSKIPGDPGQNLSLLDNFAKVIIDILARFLYWYFGQQRGIRLNSHNELEKIHARYFKEKGK